MTWLKDLVIFFFWAYKEFKTLKNDYKVNKEAKCTLKEVEKYINKEKGKEDAK